METKVSIITGYYNREEYVINSIESLIYQNFENYEILIFDDCSTDGTFENLLEITKNRSNIQLIRHTENLGFVKGMIEAIKRANGEYIAVHGSGDISKPDRLIKQSNYLDRNKDVVAVGCYYANNDPLNNKYKIVRGNEIYTREDIFKKNPFSHGEVMFRKDIYNKVGGYRPLFKFAQDKDLWIRMATFGRLGVIQEVLYERIVNFEGASYKVEKLIEQKKYSYLANVINTLSIDQQKTIEQIIIKDGIDKAINIYEKIIQNELIKMYNVLFVKKKLSNTQLFIENSRGLNKKYYTLLNFLYNRSLIRETVNVCYKLLHK